MLNRINVYSISETLDHFWSNIAWITQSRIAASSTPCTSMTTLPTSPVRRDLLSKPPTPADIIRDNDFSIEMRGSRLQKSQLKPFSLYSLKWLMFAHKLC